MGQLQQTLVRITKYLAQRPLYILSGKIGKKQTLNFAAATAAIKSPVIITDELRIHIGLPVPMLHPTHNIDKN